MDGKELFRFSDDNQAFVLPSYGTALFVNNYQDGSHITRHNLITGAIDTVFTIRKPEWTYEFIADEDCFAFISMNSHKVRTFILKDGQCSECTGISGQQHTGSQIPIRISRQPNGYIYLSLQNLSYNLLNTTLVSVDDGKSWDVLFREEYAAVCNGTAYYFTGHGKDMILCKKIVN